MLFDRRKRKVPHLFNYEKTKQGYIYNLLQKQKNKNISHLNVYNVIPKIMRLRFIILRIKQTNKIKRI